MKSENLPGRQSIPTNKPGVGRTGRLPADLIRHSGQWQYAERSEYSCASLFHGVIFVSE
ncbi:hypothetical protein ACWJKU_15710 [Methylocaldum sp. MU1018]